MADNGFVHLHLHTMYSLLDGAVAPKKLFARCKELGMEAVAITDHGNMFGAVDCYCKGIDAGVKPIIGCEVYVAPGSRFEKSSSGIANTASHLILLSETTEGYHNLMK